MSKSVYQNVMSESINEEWILTVQKELATKLWEERADTHNVVLWVGGDSISTHKSVVGLNSTIMEDESTSYNQGTGKFDVIVGPEFGEHFSAVEKVVEGFYTGLIDFHASEIKIMYKFCKIYDCTWMAKSALATFEKLVSGLFLAFFDFWNFLGKIPPESAALFKVLLLK